MNHSIQPPKKHSFSVIDAQQKQLAQHCFWDASEQTLWIDCRKVLPKLGVISVPSWDALTMSSLPIPDYPSQLKVLEWSNYSDLSYWRKQIPQWVQDSCALFPTHQLRLLHYSGKYPQVLELLDHAPMLAWRLINRDLQEPEIVALLSGKRQQIVSQVGWPGKEETVKFLRNLRLRFVNDEISEQVEICLLDDKRLTALQALPRINSMALSLAARFPELIGSRLHHALAKLPCRPMQCKAMLAQLEDTYRLADVLNLPQSELDKVGESRYLVEVSEHYQTWLNLSKQLFVQQHQSVRKDNQADTLPCEEITEKEQVARLEQRLSSEIVSLIDWKDWLALSVKQHHNWWLDYPSEAEAIRVDKLANSTKQLLVWKDEKGVWGALIQVASNPDRSSQSIQLLRVRGEDNCLPEAKQLSDLHFWIAKQ
ncbi:MAG: hypothetical protein GXO35_05140 [Gammaproteobacteria bacterium]|nr:hypothetical protein [Gammaproteobacteria bacterium]